MRCRTLHRCDAFQLEPKSMDTRAASNVSPSPVLTDAGVPVTTDIDITADLDHCEPSVRSMIEQRPRAVGASQQAPQVEALQSIADVRNKQLPLAPGRILLDRYVLTQVLGTGGTCTVFRARDLEAQANGGPDFVALKTPRPDHPNRERAIERLQREYEHARRLTHAGIVQVFALKQDGDIWFMTMELLEGQSLAMLVRRHGGTLPTASTRRLLKSAAEALAYSHAAGVVHGDFNLANAFVVSGDRVKLLDFGAACSADQSGVGAATTAYASPQVLEGATPTVRDDLFSFACVAYELIAGRHPFNTLSSKDARAQDIRPQAPEQLSPEESLALMAGLAWESDARPANVKAFAQAITPQPQLRRTLIEEDEPFIEPLPTMADDRRWWIFGGVCFVVLIVAVVATRVM
jgi:serine/threonine protein kinase